MNPLVVISARSLHALALSLWLGGLVAIGALVAPTAFHVTRTLPAFAGNLPLQNAVAGAVVGGSLRLFNWVCLASAAGLLLTNFLLLPLSRRRPARACLAAAALLLLSALYLTFVLTPALDHAQALGQMPAFDRMHHQYEQISTLIQLPLLLLLTLLGALRDYSAA